MSILYTPWTQQPQQAVGIDWSNPITRGLFFAVTPTASGAVESVNSTLSSNTGTPSSVVGEKGIAGTGNASSYRQFADRDSYDAAGPITLIALINGSSATLNGPYISKGAVDTSNNPFFFGRVNSASLYLSRGGTSDYQRFITGNTIQVPDRLCVVGVTQNGVLGAGATCNYFLDGVTNGVTNGGGMSNTAAVGNSLPVRCLGTAEKMYLGIGWSRVLSNAEICSISQNPWQIFKPIPRRIFVPVAASSGIYTLNAQSGSYTTTGQSATLLRHRNLSASSGSYSVAGQSVNITYSPTAAIYTLTAQTGSYGITGRSATLLRHRSLSATTGSYTISGQSAGLFKNRVLTASSGSYSITGRSVTITYTPTTPVYTLTAQTGTYALTGQTATLLKHRLLTGSSGTYTYTGRPVTINKYTAGSNNLIKYINVLTGEILILKQLS